MDVLHQQGVYTTILLCNRGSGRFTLIYHEDSSERGQDPVEFQRSFLPADYTLHQAEPWLTFKSWASWLVLKKKCQVIIDRNFCRGKTNTWNLYYPQGRAATEERHLQNNSFLLLFYWSDQDALPAPLLRAFFTVPGPVMSGSLPNHIRAWSKLQEQEGEQENLISHRAGIKLPATSQAQRHRAASHRPHKRLQLSGGRRTGCWTCCNLEDRI